MTDALVVHPLDLGPIVGHTTHESVRLWGRGRISFERGQPRRVYGVAQLFHAGERKAAAFFPMHAHFDATGICDFEGLDPSTDYVAKLGWFRADGEPSTLPDAGSLQLPDQHEARFRTGPAPTDDRLSFVFGSCRYMLRLFGGHLFDQRGDKTFRAICQQLDAKQETHALLMLGDQIYADDKTALFADESASEFHARYRTAFSAPHLRELMSRVPTYMMLDDHEISNDWTMEMARKQIDRFQAAMSAYHSYQLVHGPAFDKKCGMPTARHYKFEVGSASFFVMDTRTERYSEGPAPQIASEEQLEALRKWLLGAGNGYKFIASAVPMFPDYRRHNRDKWSGFPEQRRALLDFIRQHRIRKVVFLGGDVHCSAWAQLRHQDDPDFAVASIVSSPFFWPVPMEGRHSFQREGPLAGAEGYVVGGSGGFRNESNFTRVTAENGGLRVQIVGRKGEELAAGFLEIGKPSGGPFLQG